MRLSATSLAILLGLGYLRAGRARVATT